MLSDSMRLAMETLQTPEAHPEGYGLGLQITGDSARRVLFHGGAVAGYSAAMAFDPETHVGVILLRNYDRGRTNLSDAAVQLVRRLAGERSGAPQTPGLYLPTAYRTLQLTSDRRNCARGAGAFYIGSLAAELRR